MPDQNQRFTELIPDGLTVLNDIREYLEKITPEQIESARRYLTKEKVGSLPVIGTVTSPTTRKLYALFRHLDLESEFADTKSKQAADETTEKIHLEQSAVLTIFSDLARSLFWSQAKMDLGFHENASIGVREGWVIVRQPEGNRAATLMTRLGFMGGIEEEG